MSSIKSKVLKSFKLNGLSLRSEASKLLVEVLSDVESDEVDDWIKRIVETVQKLPLEDTFIDRVSIETAINECNQGNEEGDNVLNCIDAFSKYEAESISFRPISFIKPYLMKDIGRTVGNIISVPHFAYNKERKKFFLDTSKRNLHGSPEDKADMFLERYTLLYQRTLHHKLFTPATVAASSNAKSAKFTLKPVEHLLGCSGTMGEIIVLGMLSRMKEDKYYLEDPSGAIELDLSKTVFHTGLFTENCFVLAEGSYEDGILHVTALGFPPVETAPTTRAYFGNINFFGGSSNTCVASSVKLKQIEQEEGNQDNMFVFISDLWLDQPKVLAKFRTLLKGYSELAPTAFVICGNFLSQPYASKQTQALQQGFQDLGKVIGEFDDLVENSRFIFVPGPQDPGPGNILPRPPLSKMVTQKLRDQVPFAEFVSNPCRIQYCTQEIVVYREDIVNKMCRHSLHLPQDLQQIPTNFVKTVISQAHLCPLPLHIRPVYWAYDDALRLYPLPNVIVCADKFESYNINTSETICMNPGSFSRNEYCFKVYWPATRELEECKVTT